MKINYGRLEVDGSEWYGLVNTVRDAAAKKASGSLTQAQFEFLKLTVSGRYTCVHGSNNTYPQSVHNFVLYPGHYDLIERTGPELHSAGFSVHSRLIIILCTFNA